MLHTKKMHSPLMKVTHCVSSASINAVQTLVVYLQEPKGCEN
jgi:hypothetical protein